MPPPARTAPFKPRRTRRTRRAQSRTDISTRPYADTLAARRTRDPAFARHHTDLLCRDLTDCIDTLHAAERLAAARQHSATDPDDRELASAAHRDALRAIRHAVAIRAMLTREPPPATDHNNRATPTRARAR